MSITPLAQPIGYATILARTTQPLNTLIHDGFITVQERNALWQRLLENRVDLEFSSKECDTWSTFALQQLIQKVAGVSRACFSENQEQPNGWCTSTCVFDNFSNVVDAVQRTYRACVKEQFSKLAFDFEARPQKSDYLQFLGSLIPRIRALGPAQRAPFFQMLETCILARKWIQEDSQLCPTVVRMICANVDVIRALPFINECHYAECEAAYRVGALIGYAQLPRFQLTFRDGASASLSYATGRLLGQKSEYFGKLFTGTRGDFVLRELSGREFTLLLETAVENKKPDWDSLFELTLLSVKFSFGELFSRCCRAIVEPAPQDIPKIVALLCRLQLEFQKTAHPYLQEWEKFRDESISLLVRVACDTDYTPLLEKLIRSQVPNVWLKKLSVDYLENRIRAMQSLSWLTHLTVYYPAALNRTANQRVMLGCLSPFDGLDTLEIVVRRFAHSFTVSQDEWEQLPLLNCLTLTDPTPESIAGLPTQFSKVKELRLVYDDIKLGSPFEEPHFTEKHVFPYLCKLFGTSTSNLEKVSINLLLPITQSDSTLNQTFYVTFGIKTGEVAIRGVSSYFAKDKLEIESSLHKAFKQCILPHLPMVEACSYHLDFQQ